MPPKRLNDQRCSIKIDVWSLGVGIFQVAKHDFPPLKRSGRHDKRHHLSEGDDLSTHEVEARPRVEDEPWLNIIWSDAMKDFIEYCLDEDGGRRKTSAQVLEHEWMIIMEALYVDMRRFIARVWGWDDTDRDGTGRDKGRDSGLTNWLGNLI
jgi:mitogen-activated protein kinase kinase